jgi:hypothetical protein
MTIKERLQKSDPKNYSVLENIAYITKVGIEGHCHLMGLSEETADIFRELMISVIRKDEVLDVISPQAEIPNRRYGL